MQTYTTFNRAARYAGTTAIIIARIDGAKRWAAKSEIAQIAQHPIEQDEYLSVIGRGASLYDGLKRSILLCDILDSDSAAVVYKRNGDITHAHIFSSLGAAKKHYAEAITDADNDQRWHNCALPFIASDHRV